MTVDWSDLRRILLRWLAGMLGLVWFFAAANLVCSEPDSCGYDPLMILNLSGAAVIIGLGIVTILALLRISGWLMLTPLIPFAAGTIVFYGFGPTSNFLASEATRNFQALSVWSIRPEQTLTTNLLTCIGIACVIMGMLAVLPGQRVRILPKPSLSLEMTALLFLVAGLAVTHLVIMPSIYGLSDFFLPGALRNLRQLPDLGFALVAYLAVRKGGVWRQILWLLLPIHVILLLPEFSKRSVTIAILMPAIGAFIGHRSWKRLALWGLSIAILFTALQTTNSVVRPILHEATIRNQTVSLAERLDMLFDTRFGEIDLEDRLPAAKIGVESWWLRLNYSGQQAAAMRLYDSGIRGEFTQNPLIYFIPRSIWPEKPVMASPGMDFNRQVTGNPLTETKVGASIYADGYWKLGWPGAMLFGTIAGLVFGTLTRLTMNQIASGQLLYLPAVMLGVNMGATGVNKFLQNGIISGLPIYIAYCLIVFLFHRFLMQRQRPAAIDGMPNRKRFLMQRRRPAAIDRMPSRGESAA